MAPSSPFFCPEPGTVIFNSSFCHEIFFSFVYSMLSLSNLNYLPFCKAPFLFLSALVSFLLTLLLSHNLFAPIFLASIFPSSLFCCLCYLFIWMAQFFLLLSSPVISSSVCPQFSIWPTPLSAWPQFSICLTVVLYLADLSSLSAWSQFSYLPELSSLSVYP
jgi:hypothetical protein